MISTANNKPEKEKKKSISPIAIALINLVVLLGLAIGIWYFFFRSSELKPTVPVPNNSFYTNSSFSVQLHNKLKADLKNASFVVSPYSIENALSILMIGSKNETLNQFYELFQIKNNKNNKSQNLAMDHFTKFKIMNKKYTNLHGIESVNISVFNHVYVNKKCQLKTDYKKTVSGLVENLPEKPSDAVKHINGQVKKETHSKITNILSNSDINSDTMLVVLNTIHFEAKFLNPFPEDNTIQNSKFYKTFENKESEIISNKITLMHNTKDSFKYATKDGNTIVRLPYLGTSIELVLIKQSNSSNYRQINSIDLKHLKYELKHLDLYIPKFKIEFDREMTQDLKSFGLTNAFGKSANFNGICDNEKIFISLVKHKAMIEVYEKGTIASAATVVMADNSYMPDSQEKIMIKFNHPFDFYLYDFDNNQVIFEGSVNNPKN